MLQVSLQFYQQFKQTSKQQLQGMCSFDWSKKLKLKLEIVFRSDMRDIVQKIDAISKPILTEDDNTDIDIVNTFSQMLLTSKNALGVRDDLLPQSNGDQTL